MDVYTGQQVAGVRIGSSIDHLYNIYLPILTLLSGNSMIETCLNIGIAEGIGVVRVCERFDGWVICGAVAGRRVELAVSGE